MNVDHILAAETACNQLARAIGALPLDQGFCDKLATASQIMAEVRHFAWCWHETDTLVEAGEIISANHIRAQLTERLLAFCKP